jgi:hypothetical protein
MQHLLEYSKWTSDSTADPGDEYNYQYTSREKIYYGIHPIQFQYEGGPIVNALAKFDTGAKTTSISYDLGKRIGVPDNLFKVAHDLEEEKIDKSASDEEIKLKIEDLEKKYPGMILDKVRSASGVSIRVYFPITLYFNGRTVMTIANIKDRTGLKADALVGLGDML